MASSLRTQIKRLTGRGAEDLPFYSLILENSQLLSGRSLSIVIPASFEDLVGLHSALTTVVERVKDGALVMAKSPGMGDKPFVEVEEEGD